MCSSIYHCVFFLSFPTLHHLYSTWLEIAWKGLKTQRIKTAFTATASICCRVWIFCLCLYLLSNLYGNTGWMCHPTSLWWRLNQLIWYLGCFKVVRMWPPCWYRFLAKKKRPQHTHSSVSPCNSLCQIKL